jgi:hypothetical protein
MTCWKYGFGRMRMARLDDWATSSAAPYIYGPTLVVLVRDPKSGRLICLDHEPWPPIHV